MKKFRYTIIAVMIALAIIVGLDFYTSEHILDMEKKAIYYNSDNRNNCHSIMDDIINEKSIAVYGSSELSAADEIAYPPSIFDHGNSDFNIVMIGRGYMQSLNHAIDVGAMSKGIENKKVVLIISPQWFTESHLSSDVFCSRFSETSFVELLKNESVSKETKERIYKRVKSLLSEDPVEKKRVEKYADIYLKHTVNPFRYIEMYTWEWFRDAKTRFELCEELEAVESSKQTKATVKAEKVDYDMLLKKAEEQGELECTNNEYGIYNEYYDTYIKEDIKSLKDSASNSSYLVSKEYDDLRLFLDVCKETGIRPLIVSVPVNGRWYDYTGFSRDNREQYYQNIRALCKEYQVEIADFSDKEYELYFLKDIMHLGWKGWVYFDQAAYDYYKK